MLKLINKKHKGVVGFEYIITLVMMSTALYGTYNTLSGSLNNKGNEIAKFIDNNGQNPLNGGSNSSGSTSNGSNNGNSSNNTGKDKNDDNTPIYWTKIDYDYKNYCEKAGLSDNEYHWGNDAYDRLASHITLDNLIKYMERKHIDTIYGFYEDEIGDNVYGVWPEHSHLSHTILYSGNSYFDECDFDFQNPAYTTSKPIPGVKPLTLDKLKEYQKMNK